MSQIFRLQILYICIYIYIYIYKKNKNRSHYWSVMLVTLSSLPGKFEMFIVEWICPYGIVPDSSLSELNYIYIYMYIFKEKTKDRLTGPNNTIYIYFLSWNQLDVVHSYLTCCVGCICCFCFSRFGHSYLRQWLACCVSECYVLGRIAPRRRWLIRFLH